MELQGKKAVFLGDSITEGVGTTAPEYIYLNVLKKSAGLREAVNYGISGTRISRQPAGDPTETYNRDFCSRYDSMDDDADIVVVFGGTNDFGHGMAPVGGFSDRTPDTFYGACHYLFAGLLTKYPDAQIVILSPMHRHNELSINGDEKPYAYGDLLVYRAALMQVAAYYSIPVLDMYAVSGIQPAVPAIREKYMPDGLHPSDAGNIKIAQLLEGFLRQL